MEALTQYESSKISQFQNPFWLAGTNFKERQAILINIEFGEELDLIPDPDNKYDITAVKVCTKKGVFVGWVPGKFKNIFKSLMKGVNLKGIAIEMREPNDDFNFYNMKVQVYKIDP